MEQGGTAAGIAAGDGMTEALRVAILGAESSGKSTLAAALAERYDTVWVPEFLREFVDTRARVPCATDQFFIARTQVEREAQALPLARRFLFCDTTPLMTAIYSRRYFDGVDEQLAELVARTSYDLTLVTAPDSPWVADGLQRESDEIRQQVHAQLLLALAEARLPYLLLEGPLEQRIAQAAPYLECASGAANL